MLLSLDGLQRNQLLHRYNRVALRTSCEIAVMLTLVSGLVVLSLYDVIIKRPVAAYLQLCVSCGPSRDMKDRHRAYHAREHNVFK